MKMFLKKKGEKTFKKLNGKRANIIEKLAENSIKKVKVDLNSYLVKNEFKITNELLECMNNVEADIKQVFQYKLGDRTTFLSIIKKNQNHIDFYKDVSNDIKYTYLSQLIKVIEKQIEHLENIAFFITNEHEKSNINIDYIIINFKQYRLYILSEISFQNYKVESVNDFEPIDQFIDNQQENENIDAINNVDVNNSHNEV